MPVDLHVHTTASDGMLSPTDVVLAAAAAGVNTMAITDHDTTGGLDEAIAFAVGQPVSVVPGVELSVSGGAVADAHLLGLLIDHGNERLAATLAGLRERREARARAIVDLLAASGHPIEFETVAAIAGPGSIGRVHIARALVAAGSAQTIDDAFRRLIGRDAPFYVSKGTLAAAEAIDAIHAAGGVAVLAHPGVSGEAALFPMIDAGLDGIEAFHAEHTARDQARFAALAARLGLLVTGGSDFHGTALRSAPIGAGGCPDDAVGALRARATLYRL